MNVIDVGIVLLLLCGAVVGFKRGVIKSTVMLVGTVIAIVLAFLLKNPVSSFMYTYLPFFNFEGALKGITILNILIYEAIAFLIVFAIIMAIFRVVFFATGIIEKILKFTIVLGIPSKILGMVVGIVEYYILVFIALFVLSQFSFSNTLISESKLSSIVLEKTPVVSKYLKPEMDAFSSIISLADKYATAFDKTECNQEGLKVLLENNILTVDSANKLIEKNKLDIENASEIVKEYGKNGEYND